MRALFRRYITISQLGFITALFLCFLLLPEVYQGPGGVSNYGVQANTTALYTAGFLLAAGFTYLAAIKLRQDTTGQRLTRKGLIGLAIGYFIVLISTYPYQINELLDTIHRQIGTYFFAYINILTAWLVNGIVRGLLGVILLFTIIAGSFIAMLSIHEFTPLLSHGQALTGVGFGALLISAAFRMPEDHFLDSK